MRLKHLGLLSLAVLVSACYPARAGTSGPDRDAYVITSQELQQVPADDLYEAVQQLRPAWLSRRSGQSPQVFVNGAPRGGLDELRTFRPENASELRFINAADATTRWGTGYTAGVIDVTMR